MLCCRVKTKPYNGNKPERGIDIMSILTIIVKTIVKLVYGVIQLFVILGDGIFKLSNKLGDNLVSFDKKMTKEFEKKNREKATKKVPK